MPVQTPIASTNRRTRVRSYSPSAVLGYTPWAVLLKRSLLVCISIPPGMKV